MTIRAPGIVLRLTVEEQRVLDASREGRVRAPRTQFRRGPRRHILSTHLIIGDRNVRAYPMPTKSRG